MRGLRGLGDLVGLLLVLAALVAVFSLTTDHFFSPTTFRTILNQAPDAIVIAVGMTLVLIIGGIDLSVGSLLALGGSVLGLAVVTWELPLPLAVLLCLATGAAAGFVNGWVITRWALPPFIVTLGMLEAARGGAYLLTDSRTLYIGAPVERITEIAIAGVSAPFLVAIAVVAFGQVLLSHTRFGRHCYAVGANEEAARLSGVPVTAVKRSVYVLTGMLVGVAAVIHCARLAAANPNAGVAYELQAIAAVVIGGASLLGGRGSLVNTLVGVLIIAVLQAGLAQAGAGEPTKRLVTGAVIVAAVIADHYRRKWDRRK